MATVTWNPSDKNASIALTGSNLIATSSAGSGTVNACVRATQAVNFATRTYFEVTFSSSASAQYFSIGVMNGSASLSANMGATNGIAFVNKFGGASSAIYVNGVGQGNIYPALVNGQVIRVAVDRLVNKIWWAINNNTWSGSAVWMGDGTVNNNPVTGLGGANLASVGLPIYPAFSSAWTGDVGTFNGGTAAFAYAIPAGFTALDSAPAALSYAQVTQATLEQFLTTIASAQVTQVAVEQWASTGTITGQALVTQVALEQWVPVAPPFTELGGDIVPQIALGGSLGILFAPLALGGGMTINVVLGACTLVSGPLWMTAPPVAPPWVPSEFPPPSLWTPVEPCDPVVWSKSGLCHG